MKYSSVFNEIYNNSNDGKVYATWIEPAHFTIFEQEEKTMEHKKENAFSDFMKMIRNSWTYDRMTDDEKKRLDKAFEWVDCCGLVGTYKQRLAILHIAYNAFLQGIGYTDFKWREQDPESIPF